MEYHGFRSIKEYENECARVGFMTRRVPFHGNDGAAYFALVTAPPKTATSIEAWTLFTADEGRAVLDGIISGGMMDPARYLRDGVDVNYLGKLAAHGYFPDEPQPAPAPAPAALEYPVADGGQICFPF